MITVNVMFFNWQFVKFKRSYNSTPTVLISINHSTKPKGNSAPVHNGLTTWIEVKFNCTVKFILEKAGSRPKLTIQLRLTRSVLLAEVLRGEVSIPKISVLNLSETVCILERCLC